MDEAIKPRAGSHGLTRGCQLCGSKAHRHGGDKTPSHDPSAGWIVLIKVTPKLKSVHGEWCSMECFWNDLLQQTRAESAEEWRSKKKEIRPC